MPFYTFNQNNSGGSFDHDPNAGIGYCVCVEAANETDANQRAEQIGLYFNGCDSGMDCDCCGDRWYEQWREEGDETPTLYGKPLTGGWGLPSYIHYLDGRVEMVPENKDAL
jgi:hypothetical protein